jgi:hypothetical protein
MKVNDLLSVMSPASRVFFENEKTDLFTDVYKIGEVPAEYLDTDILGIHPLNMTICITIAE